MNRCVLAKRREAHATSAEAPAAPKGALCLNAASRSIGAGAARLAAGGYPVAVNVARDGGAAAAVLRRIVTTGGRAVTIQADVVHETEAHAANGAPDRLERLSPASPVRPAGHARGGGGSRRVAALAGGVRHDGGDPRRRRWALRRPSLG